MNKKALNYRSLYFEDLAGHYESIEGHPQELTGYGIFWPKINGIRDTQTPPNGASMMLEADLITLSFPGHVSLKCIFFSL